jgi:hypothetical protein
MDKYRRIQELLREFYQQQDGMLFFTATVDSVEGDTCTVRVDGLSISDVRLSATSGRQAGDGVLIIPAVGSDVTVASMDGTYNNLFVVGMDVVDKLEMTFRGVNLMQTISDLISALSGTLTLTTLVGPATGQFDPVTIARLKAVETSFKQLFR